MLKRYIIGFITLLISTVVFAIQCNSPYQNKVLTVAQIQSIYQKHQHWLKAGANPNMPGRADLCNTNLTKFNFSHQDWRYANFAGANMSRMELQGIDLMHSNLEKTYFRWSDLNDANFNDSNLLSAYLLDTKLVGASFLRARATLANFIRADLQDADMRASTYSFADFDSANLQGANLNYANLQEANFDNANLSNTILEQANLRGAKLIGTNLGHANLMQADLYKAIWQPKLHAPPQLLGLAGARNFSSIVFIGPQSMASLGELRSKYKYLGLGEMEQTISSMIKVEDMRRAWQRGGVGYISSALNYVLFYITSEFGAAPVRPLEIWLLLLLIFAIPYRIALSHYSEHSGIRITWQHELHQKTVRRKQQKKGDIVSYLHRRHRRGWYNKLKEQIRLIWVSIYFSIISSFTVGYHDLNLSIWFQRIQSRNCLLYGAGWVRVLSGTQSIISVYLIVLWLLCYFGHPFEW